MSRKLWRIVIPLVSTILKQSTKQSGRKIRKGEQTRTKPATIKQREKTKTFSNIRKLVRQKRSGVIVRSKGKVVKVLPDDNIGDRHQRFILKLDSGNTVLIAHNIDIAPRVPVSSGSIVNFLGQYEWNDRGGIVHWTHHDPAGWRQDGWIKLKGKKYQ